MSFPAHDLTGLRFGRLVALVWIPGHRENGRKVTGRWECQCDCGRNALVATNSLRNGVQVSCGCFAKENARAVMSERAKEWSHPSELVAQVVAEYAAGASGSELAEKHDIDHSTIFSWVRAAGYEVRPRLNLRTYTLDETAFSTLTDESAYWVGFLLADGCIHIREAKGNQKQCVSLALAERDREHVAAFAAFLKSNRPLYSTKSKAVMLQVDSRKLCDDLISFGVTPRKSKTAKVDGRLANNVHFWRGVIDGDGSLSWTKPQPPHSVTKLPILALCGSREVCESFSRFVRNRFPGKVMTVSRMKGIWNCRLVGRDATKLATELYSSGPSLDRKAAVAQAFSEHDSANPPRVCYDWQKYSRGDVLSMLSKLGSWELVAEKMGLTTAQLIANRSRRYGISSRKSSGGVLVPYRRS